MAGRKKVSLAQKLLRIIFGAYFCVTLVVTLLQLSSEYQHTKKTISEELLSFESTYNVSLSQALWEFNREQLDSILMGLKKVEIIRGAKIEDVDGNTRSSIGIYPKGPLLREESMPDQSGITDIRFNDPDMGRTQLFQYRFKVLFTNERGERIEVGTAYFYSSEDVVINRVKHGFILILINSVIKTSSLWIIFLICVKILAERPLRQLTHAVASIDPMNPKKGKAFDSVIRLGQRNDEIGDLSGKFDELIESLIGNISQVKDLNHNLEGKVRQRTEELFQQNRKLQALLENMEMGVFTIVAGGVVHDQYSRHLETIFAMQPAGFDACRLLTEDTDLSEHEKSIVRQLISGSIGELSYTFRFNEHLLPREIVKVIGQDKKALELSWKPITDEADVVERIMVIVRDISSLKQLQRQAEESQETADITEQLLKVKLDTLKAFFISARTLLMTAQDLAGAVGEDRPAPAGTINEIFRHLHTVKGNAWTYDFRNLVEQVHASEQALDHLRQHPELWQSSRVRQEIAMPLATLQRYEDILETRILRFSQSRQQDESPVLQELAMILSSGQSTPEQQNHLTRQWLDRHQAVRLSDLLQTFLQTVPRICRDLGKTDPSWEIRCPVRIRQAYAGPLRDVLSHCLLNSLAHGIESAEERLAKGKSSAPKISLLADWTQDGLVLRLSDDGRGLDLAKLRAKAKALQGLAASDEAVAEVIFQAGVSTADTVSQMAGRGVGMDAVKSIMEGLGGSVRLELAAAELTGASFRNFTTVLQLPAAAAFAEEIAAAS